MKRSLIALGFLTALLPATAGASSRYQEFGNLTLNDCTYESLANLVLYEFPAARINPRVVIGAFRANGVNGAMSYVQDVGFSGHRVAAFTPISSHNHAALAKAASHGGVWATVSYGGHVVDITRASKTGVTVLDDGSIYFMRWADWSYYQGTPAVDYAVTWATPGTTSVYFNGMSVTSDSPSMAAQTLKTGTTATLTPNAFIQDGYKFEGWTTSENGTVVQYTDGQSYTFNQGMTLYALWSYLG